MEEDRSAWASNWLLVMRDLIFFIEAIKDMDTIAESIFISENCSKWKNKNNCWSLRFNLTILFNGPYHNLQDLYLFALTKIHSLEDSCRWTGIPPVLYTVLGSYYFHSVNRENTYLRFTQEKGKTKLPSVPILNIDDSNKSFLLWGRVSLW